MKTFLHPIIIPGDTGKGHGEKNEQYLESSVSGRFDMPYAFPLIFHFQLEET